MTAAPTSSGGSIKGSVMASRLAFVRGELGETGLAAVLARLSSDDRGVLNAAIMPFAWYSFDLYTRLDVAIAAEMGRGDTVFRRLGAASARDNLGADHKRYVQGRDPHGLLKHAAAIYKLYYDTGERTYERAGDRKAILRTQNSRTFSSADCLTIIGWHEKAIEMCGGANVRVAETQCRARGARVCEYVCEWE